MGTGKHWRGTTFWTRLSSLIAFKGTKEKYYIVIQNKLKYSRQKVSLESKFWHHYVFVRCWLLSTRPCLTTTSIWRARCSNPTWWLLDTPAPKSTALKRLPWQQSLPCGVLCPRLCQVSWACRFWHTWLSLLITNWLSSCVCCLHRCDLPVGWPEWGGSQHQPKRHQPVSSAPALGSHLFFWPGSAGLRAEGLGRQEGKRQGMSGRVPQEGPGKEGKGRG